MSKFKIVKGTPLGCRHPKRYIKKICADVVTYHNVQEVIKIWPTKYGPYNIIKQEGGRATFYNVGKEVEIDVIEELYNVDSSKVAIGYKF